MPKSNFFFKRKEFHGCDIQKVYYEYQGYYRTNPPEYPVVLAFGRNSMEFLYRHVDGRAIKLFSFYVADGEINQDQFSAKIENYWKMPVWPLAKLSTCLDDTKLFVESFLIPLSYFSRWYEFEYKVLTTNKFDSSSLFCNRNESCCEIGNSKITFRYTASSIKDCNKKDQNDKIDIWSIENGPDHKTNIETHSINFRKLLLDFIFELDNANTFEDENFFRLQPVLQNNKLLDALSLKCRFLDQLNSMKEIATESAPENSLKLPKQYLDAEKSWLKVCMNEAYSQLFVSANSIFKLNEEEIEQVVFSTQIGVLRQPRNRLFNNEDDRFLRSQISTYFLRTYSMLNAFKVLMPRKLIVAIAIVSFLTLIGDLSVNVFSTHYASFAIFSLWTPLISLLLLICYSIKVEINLFKLLLPRMSLGILVGWSVFWSSADLWKGLLFIDKKHIWQIILIIFFVMVVYVFTDIKNKLIKTDGINIGKRALMLILCASIISIIQGFYITQVFSVAMYQTDFQSLQVANPNIYCNRLVDSEFMACQFENDNKFPGKLVSELKKDGLLIQKSDEDYLEQLNGLLKKPSFISKLDNNVKRKLLTNDARLIELNEYVKHLYGKTSITLSDEELKKVRMFNRLILERLYSNEMPTSEIDSPAESGTFKMLTKKSWLLPRYQNFFTTEIPLYWGGRLLYLWPILFGQFMISILIGLVLQLLWEDRPITEPL
jgi:hypothetical protein